MPRRDGEHELVGITVTTPAGRIDRDWDESNLHANFAIAFCPLRK